MRTGIKKSSTCTLQHVLVPLASMLTLDLFLLVSCQHRLLTTINIPCPAWCLLYTSVWRAIDIDVWSLRALDSATSSSAHIHHASFGVVLTLRRVLAALDINCGMLHAEVDVGNVCRHGIMGVHHAARRCLDIKTQMPRARIA